MGASEQDFKEKKKMGIKFHIALVKKLKVDRIFSAVESEVKKMLLHQIAKEALVRI